MKVLYDYEAQDLDELTIKEGDLIDLVKEGLVLLVHCSLPPSPQFFPPQMRAGGGLARWAVKRHFSRAPMLRKSDQPMLRNSDWSSTFVAKV